MNVAKTRGRPPGRSTLPAKVMLSLSVDMYNRLTREAEELQLSLAGVARRRIARSLAQDMARANAQEREA